jgi:hypothetical protein
MRMKAVRIVVSGNRHGQKKTRLEGRVNEIGRVSEVTPDRVALCRTPPRADTRGWR